jgi:serine/threonine protein kinase/TolB-like protein/Tfp pilus assembly protein PilF
MTDSSPDRRRQVEALISEALKMPPDQRAQFLDTRCAGNSELWKEVDALLESGEHPTKLARPPGSGTPRVMASGKLFSHYKIISMLGAGGMGEVYLAEDMQLRRRVALKMIAPSLSLDERGLRRFEQEAQAASALNHPNILTVYEFGQADGVHYIASEFVDGVTLRNRMAVTKLDLSAAIDIAIQIASALAAAHESGIVHRDIKPDNVIVRTDGIVKVLDFGIAKLSGKFVDDTLQHSGATVTSSISEPGTVVGTAKYMSPEQARGLDVDARSDIFSLGSVLYELVTGRQAFPGATSSDVIAEILKSEPAPPIEFAPDLPYEVERIISKALRKERENRYQSIRDLLIDLQDFKKESEFHAKLQGAVRPEGAKTGSGSGWRTPSSQTSGIRLGQPRGFPRRKVFLGLAAVAVAAIIGLVGYFHGRKPAAPPPAARVRNLAVLPFRNLKEDAAIDFLGFSLADEIITKLGYVNSIVIRPSSSVAKYRDQSVDPQKAAAELNVDTLLTGSFIKDGDDLRITAQLIDVHGDKILWRDVIDVKYDKLLTVQDRVAQQILKGLEVRLSPAEAANLKPEKPISALAYEYYLRGVDLYSLSQFAAAIGMLEKSTQIDPNYAPAWAHLGRAYTTNASLQFGGREDYSKAQAAYEKAIALSPALLEPRIYMANLFTDTGRVEQAVPLVRSVLRDNPNNAEAHWELGYAYRFGGMLQESLEECKKAREINPQVKINSSAMNSYLYLGEYKEFLESLPENDSVYILFYRGFAEYYLKNPKPATSYFDRAYERDSSSLQAMIGEAFSYSIQHHNANGLELLKQTEAKIAERGVTDAEGMYKVAQAYAVLGDKASALRMLRASIAGGFFPYPYFMNDPLLQDLHGAAEFQSLMDQARHRHEQFKTMFF